LYVAACLAASAGNGNGSDCRKGAKSLLFGMAGRAGVALRKMQRP
jgi:hypothetical protein